jgi:hypothetical protein
MDTNTDIIFIPHIVLNVSNIDIHSIRITDIRDEYCDSLQTVVWQRSL